MRRDGHAKCVEVEMARTIAAAARERVQRAARVASTFIATVLCGCQPAPDGIPGAPNASDKTNGGARFVGSGACAACHVDQAVQHAAHGHAQALKPIQGGPPTYPIGAGVPHPPAGFTWHDVAYVIGGYMKSALFVGQDGFVLTTGVTGVDTQWNLAWPPHETPAGFVPFLASSGEPTAYELSRFQYHTTGPAFDPSAPRSQDGRSGIIGTWSEAGVQCEACHGPGGEHFRTRQGAVRVDRSRIFIDPDGSQTCAACHSSPFESRSARIGAANGFIISQSQWPELRASGGHAGFACTYCHDPHRSLVAEPDRALRNACSACHTDVTMAGHAGKVFRQGAYSEPLRCESCHMPFASRATHHAGADVVGPLGRSADTRTHIFRIDTEPADYRSMFTSDGAEVRRDAQGRAAVTVDFVCLRCHHELGNVFELSVSRAAEIARQIHRLP
jgi:hypothetical protein